MGPSCVLKVLHVLIHLILKPYAIGFINTPILQVKNGHTDRLGNLFKVTQ